MPTESSQPRPRLAYVYATIDWYRSHDRSPQNFADMVNELLREYGSAQMCQATDEAICLFIGAVDPLIAFCRCTR